MNRKTNIFYNTENDSKFLTFDNYSEALTGDILATDQKLWPSRFICMYVKALDDENIEERKNKKIDFINNYLVPYYENKLAFLRDNIDTTDELIEISPLKYLLSLMYYYAAKKQQKLYQNISEVESDLFDGSYELTENDISLCYISDIVEQDYNGTYADIICNISTSAKFKPVLVFENFENDVIPTDFYEYKEYNHNMPITKLYGWNNESSDTETKLSDYILKQVIFDNNQSDNYYYINSLINTINVEQFTSDKLKFNVVIPVFDSAYINKTELSADDVLTLNGVKNVPLGIYFTGKPIELESDNGIFNTSWSLLISMQFKSFPYSFNITHNFDDSDHIKEGYVTFAEILAKQNIASDYMLQYTNQINDLKNKIGSLESTIKSMSTVHALDEMNLEITKLTKKINLQEENFSTQIEELKRLIEESKLKWEIHKTKD